MYTQFLTKHSPASGQLSPTLFRCISDANSQQRSDQMLELFIHRFCHQARLWGHDDVDDFQHQVTRLIHHYVDDLPDLSSEFRRQCESLGWPMVVQQVDFILMRFFSQLPQAQSQVGILSILDKVYFAHRLIEELHDHMLCLGQPPLLHWNMSSSNLLVHQLLGEQYSARLDQSVIELAKKIISTAPPLPDNAQAEKSQLDGWPCFCAQYGIALTLT